MALTDEQREKLREIAVEQGYDPDEFVDAAEEPAGTDGDGPNPSGTKDGAPEPTKVFKWNSAVLTVRELRASMGFTDRVADDGMFFGEWLVKHGGAVAEPSSDAPDDGAE